LGEVELSDRVKPTEANALVSHTRNIYLHDHTASAYDNCMT